MPRDLGPPKEVPRLGTPLPTGDTTQHSTPALTKNQIAASNSRGAGGHCHAVGWRRRNPVGRHANIWREGFGCGFRDALRLAAREFDDPAVWLVLDRLAGDYDLAGEP